MEGEGGGGVLRVSPELLPPSFNTSPSDPASLLEAGV